MQKALIVSSFTAVACAIFSCFLVLKGWSLMGDAISHAVLPGIGLSVLIGLPISLGAFLAGIFCVWATLFLKNHSRVKEDVTLGVVFSGMFAVGLVLVTKLNSNLDIFHILFGNVLGVSSNDFAEVLIISVLCSLFMLVKKHDLLFSCFDKYGAVSVGVSVKLMNFALLTLLALLIISSLKSVGILLAIAMLVTPGATGFLLAKSFNKMLTIAILVAFLSSFTGILVSFHIDAASSATIVLMQSVMFGLAFMFRQQK